MSGYVRPPNTTSAGNVVIGYNAVTIEPNTANVSVRSKVELQLDRVSAKVDALALMVETVNEKVHQIAETIDTHWLHPDMPGGKDQIARAEAAFCGENKN